MDSGKREPAELIGPLINLKAVVHRLSCEVKDAETGSFVVCLALRGLESIIQEMLDEINAANSDTGPSGPSR